MTSEQHDEHQRLNQLEAHVDHGEQKERADHRRGEGYLQYGGAQLDVLTACLHGNGPPLPDVGKKRSRLYSVTGLGLNQPHVTVCKVCKSSSVTPDRPDLRLAESEDGGDDVSEGVAYEGHESTDGHE